MPEVPELELVLASLVGGVVVLAADERIAFVNPAAEAMLERSGSALAGQPAEAIYEIVPWLEALVARLSTDPDASLRADGHIDTATGSGIDVVAVASVLRDRTGHADGTVLVLHDLGSRQWLHDHELSRKRLADLDGLVARVAHELNNPLAGIRGAAQLLGSKLADRPELATYGEMIVRQADRMSELIAVLMSLEAPQPEMEALNIHRVLNDVILLARSQAETGNVEIGTAFDPSLPEVRGNSAQLQQLFLNLLRNALAVCPEREGRITVTTKMENRFYVETGSERVRYILVEVVDNGHGLDEETRAHMFSPFYTRTAGGTGLGLAIAHNIATAHKGRIFAENGEGGGACLRVALPVAEAIGRGTRRVTRDV